MSIDTSFDKNKKLPASNETAGESYGAFLALDTSNYTSSAAIFNVTDKKIYQYKKALPVKAGQLGLRQSEAVFLHIKLLPEIINILISQYKPNLKAIGVSTKPRDDKDSYMPCFLVGKSIGEAIATTNNINCHYFSHQAGHIVTTLFSAGRLKILDEDFIAFHISGGTTEMLYVSSDTENIINIEILGKTLDIAAGQVIDRVGKLLGLSFPSGKELEGLALRSEKNFFEEKQTIATVIGLDCSMSGIESKAGQYCDAKMKDVDLAKFTLDSISRVIVKMLEADDKNDDLPIVFSGGVMANSIIKNTLKDYYSGRKDLIFPAPEYATDNAVGIAILASIKEKIVGSY